MSEEDLDSADDSDNGPAYVYFLTIVDPSRPAHDFKLVKVGITKGAVERRIENLQTGNPYEIKCYDKFESPVASAVECWIHRTRSLARLEWLHLSSDEIPALVAGAKHESGRLAHIAQAWNRWKHVESNGAVRKPSDEEARIHDEARCIAEKLASAELQLELTIATVAIVAGKVGYIPGIVKIWPYSPFGRFSKKMACEQFPELAAAHMTQKVTGSFRWKNLPTRSQARFAEVKTAIEAQKQTRQALDAEMLGNRDVFLRAGGRTGELIDLHGKFIHLMQEKAQLEIEKEYLRAQIVQTMENAEAVDGVCSFGRRTKTVLDAESFRNAYRSEALQCWSKPPDFVVRRRVFLSRSY